MLPYEDERKQEKARQRDKDRDKEKERRGKLDWLVSEQAGRERESSERERKRGKESVERVQRDDSRAAPSGAGALKKFEERDKRRAFCSADGRHRARTAECTVVWSLHNARHCLLRRLRRMSPAPGGERTGGCTGGRTPPYRPLKDLFRWNVHAWTRRRPSGGKGGKGGAGGTFVEAFSVPIPQRSPYRHEGFKRTLTTATGYPEGGS